MKAKRMHGLGCFFFTVWPDWVVYGFRPETVVVWMNLGPFPLI